MNDTVRDVARPRAVTRRGYVELGNAKLDCYVLDNGQRVFTQRAVLRALGEEASGHLQRVIDKIPVRGHDLADAAFEFVTPEGAVAIGREAHVLGRIAGGIVTAAIDGTLPDAAKHLARPAAALVNALAGVALEALVDEACDYQSVRAGDYLRKRLEAFLRDEAAQWERTFTASLTSAIAKLYGHTYDGGSYPRWMRSVFAKLYALVLGHDVARAQRDRNPEPRFGSNHHQFLTDDAQRLLRDDLRIIEVIASQSGSADEFWTRVIAHYRKQPFQLAFGAWGRKPS